MIETEPHYPELARLLSDLLGNHAPPPSGEVHLLAYPALEPEDTEMVFRDLRSLTTGNDWPRGVVIYWPSEFAPWEGSDALAPRERSAFELGVRLVRDVEQARCIIRNTFAPVPDWAIAKIRAVLEAKDLYAEIRGFSHAGAFDLTNHVLGPARLILKKLEAACEDKSTEGGEFPTSLSGSWNSLLGGSAGDDHLPKTQSTEWNQFLEEANRCWGSFLASFFSGGEIAVENTTSSRAVLARVLRAELVRHARNLPKEVGDWTRHNIGGIESLLDGLTECRTKSGFRTPSPADEDPPSTDELFFSSSSAPEPIGEDGSPSKTLRVLVVDDHVVPWKPVLRAVHKQLEHRFGTCVRMDFSTDGRWVRTNSWCAPLLGAIAEYDVVLLDIFLDNVFGLSLLRRIRTAFLYLPVVLWTASRDIDLPSGANLANGFLFKKTTTFDDIVETLGRWLEHGRSARVVTLPNRFFDHTIRRREHRETISSLTRWALQLMDGFPALSDSYFRGFTDHGGRHFVQLLQHTEQLIRPLLLTGYVFSSDLGQREEELTALYLGLVCHEFGMFPVFAQERKVKRLNSEESRIYRGLHAVRGMEFLDADEHWPVEFRAAVAGVVDSSDFLRTALPLIVGYHSRLLPLETFGKVEKHTKAAREIKKRGGVERQRRRIYIPSVQSVQETLARLTKRDAFRERGDVIPRLCGLVRFVDSIDIDRSRLPAPFLRRARWPVRRGEEKLAKWERRQKDYAETLREYVKQELVSAVRVDRGRVSIDLIVPKPTDEVIGELEHLTPEVDLGVVDPWSPDNRQIIGDLKRLNDLLSLDIARLKGGTQLGDAYSTSLREASPMRDRILATVAALAVAGQILDEYEAIEVCGLDGHIQLGEFSWGRDESWLDNAPVLRSLYGKRGGSSRSRD